MEYEQHIFVFGSNLSGRHGRGAALHAKKFYGAEAGIGEGLTGRTYALPTKDADLNVRSLSSIRESLNTFHQVVMRNPNMLFFLTPIGTGPAGVGKNTIMNELMCFHWPTNLVLTSSWINTKDHV